MRQSQTPLTADSLKDAVQTAVTTRFRDPVVKAMGRWSYRYSLGLETVWHLLRREPVATSDVRVFYGGAISGHVGGGPVKVRRLTASFPEFRRDYNLAYVLSNAPYLPGAALWALKLRGVPIVHNQNGVFYPAWYDGNWRAANKQMAQPYLMADHVFYQSEFCRRVAERFLGEREGPGEVLYNAVDTKQFAPHRQHEGGNTVRFLVCGKIPDNLLYRVDSTLQGLAAARKAGLEATLHVAGWMTPAGRDHVVDLAVDLDLTDVVSVSGTYDQEQAPGIYNNADVYVITTHNDNCPSTVLEAMACGLPVLHVTSGGVPELVGNDAGVAIETGESWDTPIVPEAAKVAAGMQQIATDWEARSQAARARAVEKFDVGPWLERHRQVFRELLGAGD